LDKQDPALYEGDIQHFGDKNSILSNSYRWPNAKIPYEISDANSKEHFPDFFQFGWSSFNHDNLFFIKKLPNSEHLSHLL
jgi:hypothetical protein